jgi:hypothetical protein
MKTLLFILLLSQTCISYATTGAPLEEAFGGRHLHSSGPRPEVPVGTESGYGAPLEEAHESLLGTASESKYPYFRPRPEPRTDIEKIVNALSGDQRKELNNFFNQKLAEFKVLEGYEAVGGKVTSMDRSLIPAVKRAIDLSSTFAREFKKSSAPDTASRKALPTSGFGTKQEQYKSLGFSGSYHERARRK